MSLTINPGTLLFENADWDFATIQRINDAVEDIALRRPTLDEVFLALTGRTTSPQPTDPAPSPSEDQAA